MGVPPLDDNWLRSKPMMIGRQMDVVPNVEKESARYGIFWATVWSDRMLKGAPTKRLQLWLFWTGTAQAQAQLSQRLMVTQWGLLEATQVSV